MPIVVVLQVSSVVLVMHGEFVCWCTINVHIPLAYLGSMT